MKKIYTLASAVLVAVSLHAQTVPPYTQDFSVFPPENWSFGSEGDEISGPTSTYSEWAQAPFVADTEHNDPSIRIEMYTTSRKMWAITNSFDLSEGGYQISFDYGATNSAYSSDPAGPAPTIECDDEFKLLVSVNGGTTWEELQSWTSPNSTFSNTGTTFTKDISDIKGNDVKFAFYAYDGAVYTWQADYRIYIDNFKVKKNSDLSIQNSEKSTQKIYPNPTTGKVIYAMTKTIKKSEIYNIEGKYLGNAGNSSANLSSYPAGIYLIRITFEDGTTKTEKIIKK